MSVVSENDQLVARCLLELFRRGPSRCDGMTITYDQAIQMLYLMHPPAHPRVPVVKIVFTLSQIDQLIPPKLNGDRGYTISLGWNDEKLMWLEIGGLQRAPGQIDKLEALAKLASASEVYFPEERVQFCWF